MASRHLSRSVVLQTLFESDMQNTLSLENAKAILKRNLEEYSLGDTDRPFADALLAGVLGKREEVDAIIQKAAPQWPLDKIAPVDRNVLRIGLYELLFGDRDATPPKVALNEAIELGKSYGGDSSGKFVNGVLGAVYREIGEPGKADAVKVPTPLPHESLGGVVLTAVVDGVTHVALVHDIFGRWTLPKTKCQENELSDAAATRALKEELGVTGALSEPIGEHEYIAHEPNTGRIVRTVGYFLAKIETLTKLKCKECKGITEAQWFSEEEISRIPTYNDLLPIIESAIAATKRA
jgi:N utilization substance protein B